MFQTLVITLLVLVIGTLLMSMMRNQTTQQENPDKESSQPTADSDPAPAQSEPLKEDSQEEETLLPSDPSPEDTVEEVKSTPKVNKDVLPSKTAFKKVIIYGPSNSNKTKIFYRLLLGDKAKDFTTGTSIQINDTESFKFKGKKISLVDIPGHSNFESKVSNHLNKDSLILFITKAEVQEKNHMGKMTHKFYDLVTKNDLKKLNITLAMVVLTCQTSAEAVSIQENFVTDFQKEVERIKFSRRTHVNIDEGQIEKSDYLRDIKDNFKLNHIKAAKFELLFFDQSQRSILELVEGI